MRLVDADQAAKYFYEHLDDLHMIAAKNAIDEMPTIEAQPVNNGKWKPIDFIKVGGDKIGMFQCSNCSQGMPWETNYCPNCGAFMRGDKDESCKSY